MHTSAADGSQPTQPCGTRDELTPNEWENPAIYSLLIIAPFLVDFPYLQKLAPERGVPLTEPLPSNDKRDTHTDTQTLLCYDMDRIDDASNSASVVACIRCRGNVYRAVALQRQEGYTYRHTD
jgi:hypothetical protein